VTGFFNLDGKCCGITGSLTLFQYVWPFMELVASREGKLCTELCAVMKYLHEMTGRSISNFNKRDKLGNGILM